MASQRQKRIWLHGANALLVTVVSIGIAVVGYVLVDRYRPFRLDLTRSGLHSLAPKTIDLLGRLDREVEVTFFLLPRSLSPDAHFVNQKVTDLLEEYQIRSGGKVRYDMANPLTEEVRVLELGGDLGAAVFRSGEQKVVVQAKEIFRTEYGQGGSPATKFTGEAAFDAALIRLMEGKSRTACFLTGHGEPSIDSDAGEGFGLAKELLRRENFESREISLGEMETPSGSLGQSLSLSENPGAEAIDSRDVPERCTVLVVAAPTAPISGAEADGIVRFFQKGNGVVLFAEPMTDSGVEALALRLGVEVLPGVAIDPTSQRRSPLTLIPELLKHEIVADLAAAGLPVVLPKAVGLATPAKTDPANQVTPLMRTSVDGMELVDIKDGTADPNSDKNILGPIVLGYAVERTLDEGGPPPKAEGADEDGAENVDENGEPSGPATTRTARAVVIGDADFARNGSLEALSMQGAAGNVDLLKNSINWAAGAAEKIGISPKDPEYNIVTITDRNALWVLLGTGLVMPAGIFATGFAVWIRRRRR